MSRIGKLPITIPGNVSVIVENRSITVNGPKGSLTQSTMPRITVSQDNGVLFIQRNSEDRLTRAQHGLMRSLINNMITGVSQGFEKKLELNGVGYRVQQQGSDLKFNLGFSHDITYKLNENVQASVDQNIITISGIDKQKVGQTAAEIRSLKKPEPYKGKGMRYIDERIIRKSGKSGKEQA